MAAKKQKQKAAPVPEVEFFYDLDQRGREWLDLRLGVPTASRFSAVVAEGRDGEDSLTRAGYMNKLAGEIITGHPDEGFQSEEMRRGIEMEPLAREHFFRSRFDEPRLVGFARRRLPSGRFVGCSPDCQIGDAPSGLEIKTIKPERLIPIINGGAAGFPPRFRAQLQGTMLVTGWQEMFLLLYYAGDVARGGKPMYAEPFRVLRDEAYIKQLSDALEVFDFDLHKLVADTRSRMR